MTRNAVFAAVAGMFLVWAPGPSMGQSTRTGAENHEKELGRGERRMMKERADDCSEFRFAVHERDSARLQMVEGAADEDSLGDLMADSAVAARRVDRLAQALVASRGDHRAANILEALDEVDTAATKLSTATSALDGGPHDRSTKDLGHKVLLVALAIEDAREALVYTLCP